jgi:hypothetical protein
MVHSPAPPTLAAYRAKVLEIDNRYWRREEEKKREVARTSGGGSGGKTSSPQKKGSSNSSSQNTSSQGSGSNSNNQGSGQKKPWNNKSSGSSGSSSGNKSGSSNSAGAPKPYANLLGPDGKLTQAERDRRKKFNLCMFCGGKHKAENCDKKKQSDSKARAASTEESANVPTGSGSEK